MSDENENDNIVRFETKFKAAEDDIKQHDQTETPSNFGINTASEIIGYPIGGGLLGFAIDKLAGTLPAFLLLGAFLGFCASIYRAYRMMEGEK